MKVEFVTNFFKERFVKKIRKILDVSAGSGYYIYTCTKLGFELDRIEINAHCRKFAKQNFAVNLLIGTN